MNQCFLKDQQHQAQIYPDKISLEDELDQAREVDIEARDLMQDCLACAEHDKPIDLERSQRVISNIVDSVIRNPDALVCLSQLKDVSMYTALHSVRTAILAVAFGRHLVLSRDELTQLGLGALIHDIGMVKMPKELLNKPTALSVPEFNLMKTHVPRGVAMLELAGFSEATLRFVAKHHECYDGSGYPHGSKETKVSVNGAIGAIIDVYDALTSKTAYRDNLSADEVLKKMYEWRE